jgi:hypothetical protein
MYESIASDFFTISEKENNLSPDVCLRLAKKFLSFQDDREKIQRRIESYVVDFNLYETREDSATRTYEALEERYSTDAPNLNHLIITKESVSLWNMRDIAIILGRNVSSVLRTLKKIEVSGDFARRLDDLTIHREDAGRDASTLYGTGVFEIIVDYYEASYLERFTNPRHGVPLSEDERAAVMDFWMAMKSDPDGVDPRKYENAISNQDAAAVDMNYPCKSRLASLYQCLRLILKRVFSIKMGGFLILFFSFVFEMSRRFPLFNILAPIVSIAVLAASIAVMARHKLYTPWIADAGACSVTVLLLWTLSVIATPDGTVDRLLPSFIAGARLTEERSENPKIPAGAVRSYPNAGNGEQNWDAALNDPKFFITETIEWAIISEFEGRYVVTCAPLVLDSDGIIEKIMYGINKKTPDVELYPKKSRFADDFMNRTNPQEYEHGILVMDAREEIDFVSIQLFFKDGSKTEVRIYEKTVYNH